MITEEIAKDCLKEKTEEANFSHSKWLDSEFASLKFASSIARGYIGENFFAGLLKLMGYKDVRLVMGWRGHDDIAIKWKEKECLIGVRVATKDVHSNFQFIGIGHDTGYAHLFCLGISPNSIGYLIIPENELDDHSLASIARGSNDQFKITKKDTLMRSFDLFESDVKAMMNSL